MQTASLRPEIAAPAAYRDKLQSLLQGREPIAVLARTPDELARIVAGRSAEFLRRRPFEGKWTPAEIIGHLVDAEWTFGYRIRAVLCDDRPQIIGMDQERWASEQRHNERDAHELLNDFRALREMNVRLWRSISPDKLTRVGWHNERGEESLGLMLRMEAGHDLSHIDQLTRYLAALDAPSAHQ